MPDRWKLAGRRICGPYIGIFDGVQADLEFVRKIFYLRRSSISIIMSMLEYINSIDPTYN